MEIAERVRALIIGGNRFVGYALAWRLIAGGHRVTLLNRGSLPDPFGDRVERLTGDRTTSDFERLLGGRRFDAVFDFAAYQGSDVERAARLFGGSRGDGGSGEGGAGHYVFVSTGQVYLVREGCPKPASERDYEGPLRPRPTSDRDRDLGSWEYGVGKRACEDALAAAWAGSRFPGTSIRIPMVNGERDDARRLEVYLWRLLDGGPVIVPDGGDHPVRHVYSGEIARALASICGNPATFGEAYNLCQEEAPSLADLLRMLARILGSSAELVSVPSEAIERAGLDLREVSPFSSRWMSMLDPSKARRDLGFSHEPLESYLGKIVASLLAHPPKDPPEGYARRAEEIALAKGARPLS
jgi:nucleoside-diphosphate-sugar epimerase